MEFSKELRANVFAGDITVTFRLWQRAQVKVGRRYRVGSGRVEIDSMELIPFAAIDETDAIERLFSCKRGRARRREGRPRTRPVWHHAAAGEWLR